MRDLVYLIATTLDGFIARPDGSFHEFPWDNDFGGHLLRSWPETFPAHLRQDDTPNQRFDTVLMGRATYDVGFREGITSPYPTMRQYLFSRSLSRSPDDSVTLVSSDAVEQVRALKAEEGKSIWLCGGAKLAGDLQAAGLIDEIVLKVNPIVFGRGIPLFAGDVEAAALERTDVRPFPSGHTILSYRRSG